VARDVGLLTTVIRDCDKKSLGQIARDARELVGRAREGRMRAEDMVGATFTISNLGMFDVESFVAINPPQAAILAVGTVKRVPVVNADGQLAPVPYEGHPLRRPPRHDGAEAARFMQASRLSWSSPCNWCCEASPLSRSESTSRSKYGRGRVRAQDHLPL